jgi:hypothetical protein
MMPRRRMAAHKIKFQSLGLLRKQLPFGPEGRMTIEQIVDIPANHRLVIDVPREVPAGSVILTFTPTAEQRSEASEKKVPVFGCAKEQFRMSPDFDAPLEDFRDYM